MFGARGTELNVLECVQHRSLEAGRRGQYILWQMLLHKMSPAPSFPKRPTAPVSERPPDGVDTPTPYDGNANSISRRYPKRAGDSLPASSESTGRLLLSRTTTKDRTTVASEGSGVPLAELQLYTQNRRLGTSCLAYRWSGRRTLYAIAFNNRCINSRLPFQIYRTYVLLHSISAYRSSQPECPPPPRQSQKRASADDSQPDPSA